MGFSQNAGKVDGPFPIGSKILERAMETAINGNAIADMDGRLVYVNLSFVRLWGLQERSSAIGKSVFGFWESPEECAAVVDAIKASGSWIGEMNAIRVDGGRFIAQVSASMVTDEGGEPIALLASFIDINENKRMHNELRRSFEQAQRHLREQEALFEAAKTVLESREFAATARKIFDSARSLIGAKSGYALLFSAEGGMDELLFDEPEGFYRSLGLEKAPPNAAAPNDKAPNVAAVDAATPNAAAPNAAAPNAAAPNAAAPNAALGSAPPVRAAPGVMAPGMKALFQAAHQGVPEWRVSVPFEVDGHAQGSMTLADKGEPFSEGDRYLAKAFGRLASIALKNDRYLDEIEKSDALHQTILDNLPIGLAFNSIDANKSIGYMNSNFLKFYRTDRGRLSSIESFWDVVYEDAETREAFRKRVAEDVASGDPERMRWEDVPIIRSGEPTSYIGAQNALIESEGLMLSTVWDTTERKLAQDALVAALENNKVLLRELYHRTKNNMNVISSMIGLQMMQSEGAEVREILHDLQNRITSMALVHQMLYRSADLSRVRFGEYARELLRLLAQSFGEKSSGVRFTTEIEDISMLIDIATPCGLLLNELITNSLRHAFEGVSKPLIVIEALRNESGEIEIRYSDNGRGFSPEVDPEASGSLGLTSIRALAEHQLQGSLRFWSDRGMHCVVRFRDSLYQERV